MNLVVLGASGSIGSQTLDVCRKNSDKISVVGIAVNSNCAMALQAVHEFGIKHVALGKANCKDTSEVAQMREMGVEVTFGPKPSLRLRSFPRRIVCSMPSSEPLAFTRAMMPWLPESAWLLPTRSLSLLAVTP